MSVDEHIEDAIPTEQVTISDLPTHKMRGVSIELTYGQNGHRATIAGILVGAQTFDMRSAQPSVDGHSAVTWLRLTMVCIRSRDHLYFIDMARVTSCRRHMRDPVPVTDGDVNAAFLNFTPEEHFKRPAKTPVSRILVFTAGC